MHRQSNSNIFPCVAYSSSRETRFFIGSVFLIIACIVSCFSFIFYKLSFLYYLYFIMFFGLEQVTKLHWDHERAPMSSKNGTIFILCYLHWRETALCVHTITE